MAADDFKDILAELPFFKGMEEEHLASLAGCASNASFRPGEVLFLQGEEANHIYVIRQGKIAVEIESADRGIVTIQTLEEGDVLGWSWLFPPYLWNFNARAINVSRTIAMDARCLRGKCEADSRLGYSLMKRFSAIIIDRLRATRLQLMDICSPSPKI